MPPRSPSELPGPEQRLGPYRLVRPVSAGGMARVYEGRLDSLAGVSTRVAVKVIHPEYADDGAFQELFIAEARISARLEHQNVVRVHQFNREGRFYYLVMEFIDGVTFRRLISQARRGRVALTPAIVAELGRQACEGLAYAHTLGDLDGRPTGLVHRDVKPSNLMLTTQGVVKVLDFGISSAQGGEGGAAAEGPAVKGTWGYMAPEQAEGRPAGPAADVFGLGAVLYELAMGEALLEDKEHAAIRAKLAQDEAARKAAALGGPWRELGSILVRALQRDPAARFPSAAAFGRALSGLVPDPIGVQAELIALSRDAAGQEAPAVPSDRPRSVSTLPRPTGGSQSGLPVVVGDDRGPARTTGTPRTTRRPPPSQTRTSLVILGVMLVALLVLGSAVVILPAARSWLAERGEAASDPTATEAAGELTIEPADVPVDATPIPGSPEAPMPGDVGVAPEVAGAAPDAAAAVAGVAPDAAATVPAVAPDAAAPPPAPAPSGAPAAASTAAASTGASRSSAPAEPTGGSPAEPAPAIPAVRPAPAVGRTAPAEPAAVGEGVLTLSSVPRAQVMLDGAFVGWTPYFQVPTPAGAHTAVLVAEDGRRKTFKVTVAAGDEVRKVWLFDEERWGE